MQILITHGGLARTRVLSFSRLQMGAAVAMAAVALLLLSGAVYHFVFLKAAREGWPVVSQLVRLVVRDEIAQREQVMQMNLDAMARKVGEMQARIVELEAVGERVSGLAGVRPEDLPSARAASAPAATLPAAQAGQGGPYLPLQHTSLEQLQAQLSALETWADQHADLLTLAESRLFESRLSSLLVPSSPPVDAPVGSGFGFRSDPFTGRPALHTGLDFSADPGTPIHAAAGGVVVSTDMHPQYGRLLEIDHGNGLTTRYAHTQRILVKTGDIVKRGQRVAEVGSSGRSTGPHLHFEVLLDGVMQNPAKFLGQRAAPPAVAAATARR
ncbi:peptidoglycan DD-metalloendopeptidase family protein [Ideonella sp.]|uniref:peptidoglycan DD-metalloendopeptidase family protein n=1 Tax=Ideonella sp. TaxID=1929293 RepID=UPI0035ADBDC6